jgi:DNA-binding Lrp family transcriptional regulator
MTKAIILINTEPGKDQKVAKDLKKVKGVEGVCLVSGLYDLVATMQGKSSEEILAAVYGEIRGLGGVRSSHTMFCLDV